MNYARLICTLFILFATLVISISVVVAFDASAGQLTLSSTQGSIAYHAGGGVILGDGNGGMLPVSAYASTSYSGFFGPNYTLEDTTPLSIVLHTPANQSGSTSQNTVFTFTATAGVGIDQCALYIDDVFVLGSSAITSNTISTVTATNLSITWHTWKMWCNDTQGISAWSESRLFTVIPATTFTGEGTNFSTVPIAAIPNLTLIKPGKGKVVFSGDTDLSNGADLDKHVKILPRSIIVNSTALAMLNKSATLTMYDLPFNYITILRDGVPCTSCTIISNTGGTLVFSVSGFSNYTTTSTAQLIISSSADLSETFQNDLVNFTANYTNTTSGIPISANCDITFDLGGWTAPVLMTYNGGASVHEYTRSFNSTGGIPYRINCTPISPGFDTLAVTDIVPITSGGSALAAINMSVEGSSRMDLAFSAQELNASAGFVDELSSMNATRLTESWQGYYGNLVGTIVLQTANGEEMYTWDIISPKGQIYATRTPVPVWTATQCANLSHLTAEDVALGMTANSGDSLTNTFSTSIVTPTFYVGNTQITDGQGCYSTKLFTAGGVQGNFTEVVLFDGTAIIYTGILGVNEIGFDNNLYDFQLIVGEDGHVGDTAITQYYFFVEIQ